MSSRFCRSAGQRAVRNIRDSSRLSTIPVCCGPAIVYAGPICIYMVCVCSSRHLVLLNGLYSARRLSVLSPCRTQLPDRCPDASFGGPGGGGAPLYQTETRPGNGHVHPGQALPAGVGVERGRPSGFSNETAPCHMPCDVQRPNYSTQRCPQHRCSMPVGHLPVVARSVKKAISRPSAWQELKSLDCNPHDKKGDSAPKTAFL
jgi:hypothetical protein